MTTADDIPGGSTPGELAEPLLYDSHQAALRLGKAKTPNWLRRAAARGEIPHTRLGQTIRWSEADLARLIEENACDPADYGRTKRRTASR